MIGVTIQSAVARVVRMGGSGIKNHTMRPIASTKMAPRTVFELYPIPAKRGPAIAPPSAKPICPRATAKLMSEPRRSSLTNAVSSAEKGLILMATSIIIRKKKTHAVITLVTSGTVRSIREDSPIHARRIMPFRPIRSDHFPA